CHRANNKRHEARAQLFLGWLLACRGAWADSDRYLITALTRYEELSATQMQGYSWRYRALRELLRLRYSTQPTLREARIVIEFAQRGLQFADELERLQGRPSPRDQVQARWLLGAAYRLAKQTDEAERYLIDALECCRRIDLVEMEADILIDLARLRAATGMTDEVRLLADDALVITERSGYVLQGADAHLELAKLALAQGDKTTAQKHAQKAKALATCDGPPDYTYKVAYDEAGAFLPSP